MAEVTQEMILDYILRKGGVVKNVELVRHFRKHLQVEDPRRKDRAREVFKERVNSVAYIKAEEGEKYLHIRPEFELKLTQPPPGHIPNGQRSSVSSAEDPFGRRPPPLDPKDSLLNLFPDQRSSVTSPTTPKSITKSKEPPSNNIAGMASQKNNIVLNSYKPVSSPTDHTPSQVTSPSLTDTVFNTPPSSSKPQSSMDFGSLGGSDFGSSLLAELSSFGPFFGNDTPSPSTTGQSRQTGLASSTSSGANTRQTGLASSTSSGANTRQTGLASSTSSGANTRQTGLASSTSSGANTRQTGLASSPPTTAVTTSRHSGPLPGTGNTSSLGQSRKTSIPSYSGTTSSEVNSPSRQTGLSSGMSTTSSLGQTRQTSSSTSQPYSSQQNGRDMNGYGSSGKSTNSGSHSTPSPSTITPITSITNSNTTTANTSSLFDDFESMFSGLDSSLSLFGSDSTTKASNVSQNGPGLLSGTNYTSSSAKSSNVSQNGPGPSSATSSSIPYADNTKSTPPQSNTPSSYQSSSKQSRESVSSYQSPSKQSRESVSSYQSPSKQSRESVSSYQSPSKQSRESSYTNQPSPTINGSQRRPPPQAPGYPNEDYKLPPAPQTNGISEVKHVTSRRPPPGPPSSSSPVPKRPAPKPPTRTSPLMSGVVDNLQQKSHENTSSHGQYTSSLGRNTSSHGQITGQNINPYGSSTNTNSYGHSTRSLGRPTNSFGKEELTMNGEPQSRPDPSPPAVSGRETSDSTKTTESKHQRMGSFGLDFLSSFGTFSSAGGTSLDSSSPQPPPTSKPPPSQPPPAPTSQPHTSQARRLGPSVELPSTSSHGTSGRRQGSMDGSSRRQGSTDAAPAIRVESPTKFSDTSSANDRSSPQSGIESGRGRSPTYTSLGTRPHHHDGSNERLSTGGHHGSNERLSGVSLRNKEGKVGRSHSNVVRRSRNFDKNSNLDNKTRQVIMATPPTARRNTPSGLLAPPEVAPKPASSNQEIHPARSREDISQYGDEEGSGSVVGTSEPDYWDIDPYEKEWMLANAQSDMETIHRLFMTESSLINRKDFIHGYTAMHWAAKQGRCDLITALALNGAVVDLKSGGLTPLHLAAAGGHDNAIRLLIKEYNANVNTRDHGGRRALDVLSPKCLQKTRALLANVNNHGLPPPNMQRTENLSSFSRPRSGNPVNLNRSWSSVGDIDRRLSTDPHQKKRNSPVMSSIRKSFSFKKTRIRETSPKKDKPDKKKKGNFLRPVSDAHAYAHRNWDV